ncbi:uncharacterized protein LOC109827198 [Asparagus officinalis]|uniref:uncharacterized protein LOC109827198 n=1 Tax=Asparagus officinalis TaxID=4686 RepID=UPI00098E63DB|nr:uncharacterized protein LOC109827198 [Asparagus officinalis]
MDFTDLNKACPKGNYPLPRIDQLVDDNVGHKLLSFMDAFSGYNRSLWRRMIKRRPYFDCNMEAYIDDILVKLKHALSHVLDLEETFSILQCYRMKLNPAKYAFKV